ncbi:FUSC family protein [Peribacillus tepidiphilus]|uniref:FUSC family protein n=1 Tax=Peribacillus tepidiphilus TaxID=2652445 RepID=UPI0035B524BF
MKLGARILKTGIAIILALFLSQLLQLPAPVFAGIAAIFAIQPTIYRSYLSVLEQIQANLIGAAVAIIFVLVFGNHVFIVGLAAIIVIIINLKLNSGNTIILSLVTVIAIMESQGDDFLQFALIRFSTIMLGILSAFIMNLVFIPPKYETKLYHKIAKVAEDVFKWIRISTRHASEHTLLKNDVNRLKEQIIKIEQLYIMFKEEREYFKKATYAKSRKLVVYRHMIATVKKALDVLKRLNRFENEFHRMPDIFQTQIQQQLDFLVFQHEQILLKFIGKIKLNTTIEDSEFLSNKELMEIFFAQLKNLDDEYEYCLYHMMPFVSAIIEYAEHIEHLDKLVNSFHNFHKEQNEVTVQELPEEH